MPAWLQLPRLLSFVLILTGSFSLGILPLHASDQPHWIRVSSDHFQVLTDAGPKEGHEIVARFEQMRSMFAQLLMRNKVRMAEPIEIIAVASPAEFSRLAPPSTAGQTNVGGIYIAGEDRIFIVLDASVPDSWRAVEHAFAHYLLDYNYPPTQPWFDEGFAEYFSSLYFTPQNSELGSDPEIPSSGQLSGSPGNASAKSLTAILSTQAWMSLTDLLETKSRPTGQQDAPRDTLFYAESWILMHYLINQEKLPQTGTYFGLVETQNVPVPQAIEQAFGMPAAQLESAVKDYFHSLKALAPGAAGVRSSNAPASQPVNQLPLPMALTDVGSSMNDVPLPEAEALVEEMKLRIPERREAAVEDLQKLVNGVKTETVVARRALAWAAVQKHDSDEAFKELNSAMQIDSNDPWTRFGLALAAYHSGEKGARIQGLANTMESLHIVTAKFPEFAEAYNILGWADLVGGGARAAIDAMRMAVQLSPRDESYQLRLAEAYVAAKNWDEGKAILDRLKASPNPQIASSANKDLYDLPFLEKFGIRPAESGAAQQSKPPQEQPSAASEHASPRKEEAKSSDSESESDTEDSETSPPPKPAALEVDSRPMKFLKAKLLSVDCSQAPLAVLTVAEGRRTLKLRTADFQSLLVMGSDKFSCDWKNKDVAVNYRAGGKMDGDLVSIEIE